MDVQTLAQRDAVATDGRTDAWSAEAWVRRARMEWRKAQGKRRYADGLRGRPTRDGGAYVAQCDEDAARLEDAARYAMLRARYRKAQTMGRRGRVGGVR